MVACLGAMMALAEALPALPAMASSGRDATASFAIDVPPEHRPGALRASPGRWTDVCRDMPATHAPGFAARRRIRGGSALGAVAENASVIGDRVTLGLTVRELVSGAVVAVAAMAMDRGRHGTLCATLLTTLLVIRIINPVTAVSVASYLQSAFRLHDECQALVLCAPLAFLPLTLANASDNMMPLLLWFFAGATLMSMGVIGVFREALVPMLSGFEVATDPEKPGVTVLKDRAGRELDVSRFPEGGDFEGTEWRVSLAAVTGVVALGALVLGQDMLLVLCSAILPIELIKIHGLRHLEWLAPVLSLYVSAVVLSIVKHGDAAQLLLRFSTESAASVDLLSRQAGAICASLMLKLWAGISVNVTDTVSLAIFVSASLTALVADHAGKNLKPTFMRFGLKGVDGNILIDDRMPRWPQLTPGGMLRAGDWIGTVICALGGTLSACERGMDVMGCLIMAAATAMGGGTIRDLFLGHENGVPKRAFWMGEPEYLVLVFVTSIATFAFWNPVAEYLHLSTDDAWEFWWDALGSGSFTCVGTMNGIRAGLPAPIVAMCGMFSASFGGLLRDVISRHPVRIMHAHKDMYALPAYVGSLAYQTVRSLGMELQYRIAAGVAATILMRFHAWKYGWRMPVLNAVYQHKSKPVQLLQPMGTRKTKAAAVDPSCDQSTRAAASCLPSLGRTAKKISAALDAASVARAADSASPPADRAATSPPASGAPKVEEAFSSGAAGRSSRASGAVAAAPQSSREAQKADQLIPS